MPELHLPPIATYANRKLKYLESHKASNYSLYNDVQLFNVDTIKKIHYLTSLMSQPL